MANEVLYVDGVDLTTLGLYVQRVDGWVDRATTVLPTTAVPDALSHLVVGRYQVQPRALRIEAVLKASSVTVLRTNLDTLRYRLRPGARVVRVIDQNDREATGYVSGFAEVFDPAPFAQRLKRLSIGVDCPDPRRFTITPNAVAFTSSATLMPQGTAPVRPSITIAGAATNPILRYRNNAGTLLKEMTFTISLAGGESLVIDMATFTIIKNPGGSNQMATLTAGDFFAFDPNDGDYTTSAWPKLEVTSGSGTANYRRAWW